MSQELIPLWGYRTGSVENARRIRHAFAFDLTRIDLRDRAIVSAALRLPEAADDQAVVAVELTDPSAQVCYGEAHRARRADLTQVPLSAEAISDLQNAAGGFFSVDAVLEGMVGEPQGLTHRDPVQLLVIAELPATAVAAAA